MIKKIAPALAVLLGLSGLTGCGKQIDIQRTGATLVPGTSNLYRFCDGATLIYFSNWADGSNDEYEFIVYDGCRTADQVPPQRGVQNLPDSEN